MKILMISDVYFPRVNGVSTSIRTFRHELARLGHQVDLVAPDYPAGCAPEEGIFRVRSRAVPRDPEDRAMSLSGVRDLHTRLAGGGYDLVHVQTPFIAHYAGLAIARRLGVPCIETYHTFFEEYLFHYVPFLPKNWMRALARRFSRAQGGSVAALVVPSPAMRDALSAYGVTALMHVIPTGIRPAEFNGGDGARFRVWLDISADAPLMLFVGRVAHEKNIDFLLHAFSKALAYMPKMVLVVAGEGPAEPSLRRLADQLHIARSMRFVGYLDRKNALLDCYRAADAFVFASRTETQGLVLLEAMAMGLPVISTAVMGTASIVGPRRGAMVPEDNESSFATAMLRLAGDPALRARLAGDAVSYAGEWGADAMAGKLSRLYAEVAASTQVRRQVNAKAQSAALQK
jgi:glycosyltransferase involved in cell wall biosynthesis